MCKKLCAFLLTMAMVLPLFPIVFAENEDGNIGGFSLIGLFSSNHPAKNNFTSSLSPLQERLNRDLDTSDKATSEEEPENIVFEEAVTSDEQAVLDEINNNPIMVSQSEDNDMDISDENGELPDGISGRQTEAAPEQIQEEALSSLSASESGIPDSFRVEPVNSVYNVLNNNNDYVSQATGALTYEKNLLSLPGANGLDLNLSVQYNSEDAVITKNEFADTNETVRQINFNSFAVGWRFGFPTIIKNNIKKNYGWNKETQLSFPDGSSYKITNDYDNPKTDINLNLEFYKLSDMTLIRKADTKDYELTYTNGIVQTFDGTYGNIKKIKDKFNNEINFYYSELEYSRGSFFDYLFSPSYYTAQINALTKIADSAGREIFFDYVIIKTPFGKEVQQIRVKMDNITYATLQLERMENYEGVADIVSQITDGEGYTTKFQYDEKITHIFNRNTANPSDPTYTVNGSVFALVEVNLPTGGKINYDYAKARRSYVYFVPEVTISDWYEVYKISKVSDSSGFERIYEFENDYSGYPYSYLDVKPVMPNGYIYTGTPTGEINDDNVRYSCFMRQNGMTTVTVFDYKHNKIKEQTYTDSNTQNSYICGNGRTNWTLMYGDNIYHMGFISTSATTSSNRSFFYKQNVKTGDTTFLTPYNGKITSSCEVKAEWNCIFIFYKAGDGTTSSPYKLVAKSYNILNDTWSDAGEYEITNQSVGKCLSLDNMYFTKGVFYSYGYNATTLYHAVYDPTAGDANKRWTVKDTATVHISGNLEFLLNNSFGKTYFKDGDCIIEYDLATDKASRKVFRSLGAASTVFGFTIGNKTYCSNYDSVVEFDFASQEIVNTYRFPNSLKSYNFFVQKGSDGYVYFIRNCREDGSQCQIYRFNPNESGKEFTLIGNLLINPYVGVLNLPTIVAGSRCLYFIGEGIEKFSLDEPGQTQSTSITMYEYNAYNQPVSITTTRISGTQTQDGGTESSVYVTGKSAPLSSTDILGNKTVYEYTDSPYYIPTKITQFADTVNALETINTLSEDKSKIEYSETHYDNKIVRTSYTYDDTARPGNITSETVSERAPEATEYTTILQTDYGYDLSKTIVERVTKKNIQTYDSEFTPAPAQDITISSTHNILGLVTTEVDALGRTTHYGYNKNGWPTWTVYPDESTIDTFYDLSGANGGENTITVVRNDNYTVISYFDDLGRQIKQSDMPANGSETVLSTYEYSGHRISKTIDARGNYSNYGYDTFDRVVSLEQYDANDNTCGKVNVTFDDFNLARTINTAGKTGKTYYDKAGRLIREEQNTAAGLNNSTYEYDYMGNIRKIIDANGNITQNSYNDRGYLINVTDAMGQAVLYDYDVLGNVNKVTTPGGSVTLTEYDTLSRPIKTTDAMGASSYFAYDNVGNLIASKDKKGQISSLTYDSMNRLTGKVTGEMSIGYTYDNAGNILTMTDAAGTTKYTYKYNNLLESVKTPDNKIINYGYDNAGNVTGMNDYAGQTFNYTYDGANRLIKIQKGSIPISSYEYNLDGSVKKAVTPEGSTEYTYDNAMRLLTVTNRLKNSLFNGYAYEYDKIGNQIKKTESMIGNSKTTDYTYDALGRMTGVTESDGTATNYTFDANNNIMTKNMVHPADYEYQFKQNGTDYAMSNLSTHNTTYAYNANNQLLEEREYVGGTGAEYSGFIETVKSYTYDENGNTLRTEKGGQVDPEVIEYTYNPWNQLVMYKGADGGQTLYGYDGTGMRISKSQNGSTTKYYWDRGYISNEAGANGFMATNYIGIGGVFARESGGETSYMFKNGHGDVTALANNGSIKKQYDYDAYGVEKNIDPNDTNPFRYCAEYFDKESQSIYLRNRYYTASTGRFITEDPAQSGLNWYVYAGGNPIMFVDPLGLFDYDTRLKPSTKYNEDVEVLQNELKWLGFYEGEVDGLFGQETLDAVNAYKEEMKLGNTGKDWGVVGLQTWTSLGLIYRTQADINAGVMIIMVGGRKQYKDFSNPINTALLEVVQIAEGKWRTDYLWFFSQVNHKADWDIKRPDPWNRTIAENTYPGWGVKVYFNGYLMTPEELGNYTYGYIGAALGLSITELYTGSWVAAGLPMGGNDFKNEFNDWRSITAGSDDYKNR